MNVIIALVVVTIAICITGIVTTTLSDVTPGSPAYEAGLRAGDTITAVNGSPTKEWSDVVTGIDSYEPGGKALEVTYERDGKEAEAEIVPEYNEERQAYLIGITAGTTKNFFKCAARGPAATWELNKAMLKGFAMLFSGKIGRNDVAGPVGLVKVVDTAAGYGLTSYLTLLALVSLNLALFNILPIPGLDGGKIFFILLKIISGGRITDDMEYKATVAGMAILLMLFVLITVNDVMNLFGN
jgi:regulator of sigma E protease